MPRSDYAKDVLKSRPSRSSRSTTKVRSHSVSSSEKSQDSNSTPTACLDRSSSTPSKKRRVEDSMSSPTGFNSRDRTREENGNKSRKHSERRADPDSLPSIDSHSKRSGRDKDHDRSRDKDRSKSSSGATTSRSSRRDRDSEDVAVHASRHSSTSKRRERSVSVERSSLSKDKKERSRHSERSSKDKYRDSSKDRDRDGRSDRRSDKGKDHRSRTKDRHHRSKDRSKSKHKDSDADEIESDLDRTAHYSSDCAKESLDRDTTKSTSMNQSELPILHTETTENGHSVAFKVPFTAAASGKAATDEYKLVDKMVVSDTTKDVSGLPIVSAIQPSIEESSVVSHVAHTSSVMPYATTVSTDTAVQTKDTLLTNQLEPSHTTLTSMESSTKTPKVQDSGVSKATSDIKPAENTGTTKSENAIDEEELKMRLRRERIEQWKRDRAAKNASKQTLTTVSTDQPQTDTGMAIDDGSRVEQQSNKKSWNLEDDEDDDIETDATTLGHAARAATVETFSPAFILPKMTYNKDRGTETVKPAKSMFGMGTSSKPLIIFGKPAEKSTLLGKTAFAFNTVTTHTKTNLTPQSRITLDDEDDDETDLLEGSAAALESQTSASALKSSKHLSNVLEVGSNNESKDGTDDHVMDVDEADPLDAFMADVQEQVTRINQQDADAAAAIEAEHKVSEMGNENGAAITATGAAHTTTHPDDYDVDEDDDTNQDIDAVDIIAAAAAKLSAKKKDIVPVDHSRINYEPFRKDFYVEPPELANMTAEEVDQKRIDLDGIKIRGVRCPKPIEKWTHFGMPPGVLEVIRRVLKYDRPSSIQSQAIPAIVGGRDVIGIAKTGSGKTIAFLLPMFRHIKDQRPIQAMEGPIALIMTPTRELAVQIHRECKHFTKILNLRAVCCYGGSPIKDQIAELKRGAEIIICTPGRMIDLLCSNAGRVTNLRRVTYLVLDEADRMFDMGFEPQVMKMVNNIRPDRQTVLFSATFPRKMEALARKILRRPLEITVGGRSVVASDVTQIVEVHHDDETKFLRLLEILGLSSATDPDAKILIFVDRQEAADSMLNKLLRRGYPCQSLHGGKDQADRDSTLSDFKTGSTNIMIATSVAARGLDVKQLKIVVNYECPNHMEDYVHRVGRTGRAGNKGTAYTFILPEQDRFALDIVKALTMSGVEVPSSLQELTDRFMEKIKAGSMQYNSSGFGGRGLEQLDKERDLVKRIQKKSLVGGEYEIEDDEEQQIMLDDDDDENTGKGDLISGGTILLGDSLDATVSAVSTTDTHGMGGTSTHTAIPTSATNASSSSSAAVRALEIQARINASIRGKGIEIAKSTDAPFSTEVEINDYVQKARWRVTNKEQITLLSEMSGTAITTRGTFVEKGKKPGPGQRKLYLFIEGESQMALDRAKIEIKRILTEATLASMESDGGNRYSVL
ncbi:pre-mRNA processing RNA-helicase [Batrachochytrium dendrobatidis]|nr:pre-mRNA processing RNA-helicase [Batrachochytrium dendrobatidis]